MICEEKMTKAVARLDGDCSELASVRQEAVEAKNKVEAVQQQIGDPQTKLWEYKTR